MSRDCGGCKEMGAHWRWCPWVVGAAANRWGVMSERIDGLADEVGSNDPIAANHLYAASGLLLAKARACADAYALIKDVR